MRSTVKPRVVQAKQVSSSNVFFQLAPFSYPVIAAAIDSYNTSERKTVRALACVCACVCADWASPPR